VIETLAERGRQILQGCNELILEHALSEILWPSGHPSWSFLNIRDHQQASAYEIRTLMMQELMQHGILSVGTHNVSYAHSGTDVEQLLAAYDQVFGVIAKALRSGSFQSALRCEPLQPLFRVR
jgi:glutamate-1-semialdehyde 2,1-aminomutase